MGARYNSEQKMFTKQICTEVSVGHWKTLRRYADANHVSVQTLLRNWLTPIIEGLPKPED